MDESNKLYIAFKTLNELEYASIVTTGNRVYISHQISSDLKLADKTLPTQIVPIINYLLN